VVEGQRRNKRAQQHRPRSRLPSGRLVGIASGWASSESPGDGSIQIGITHPSHCMTTKVTHGFSLRVDLGRGTPALPCVFAPKRPLLEGKGICVGAPPIFPDRNRSGSFFRALILDFFNTTCVHHQRNMRWVKIPALVDFVLGMPLVPLQQGKTRPEIPNGLIAAFS
jgi:hypothetical protein